MSFLAGECRDSGDLRRFVGHFCVQLQEIPEAVLHPLDNPRHLRPDLPRHVHHALLSPDPVSLCNGEETHKLCDSDLRTFISLKLNFHNNM